MVQTVKKSAYNVGDLSSIPGSGRFPGKGNGNPLQHSCLENPKDRGAWRATVHGPAKSQTRLSMRVTLKSYVATVAGTVRIAERISFTP